MNWSMNRDQKCGVWVGWMYMTHKSSCCSNSRVIAFFNNFCLPQNGCLAPAEESKNKSEWVALVRISQIGSHGHYSRVFQVTISFTSSALKWPVREEEGRSKFFEIPRPLLLAEDAWCWTMWEARCGSNTLSHSFASLHTHIPMAMAMA